MIQANFERHKAGSKSILVTAERTLRAVEREDCEAHRQRQHLYHGFES